MELTGGVPTVRVTVGPEEMELEDWELYSVVRRKWEIRQTEVATRAGTHQSELSQWERGRKQYPGEWVEAAWAALFEMVAEKRAARIAESEAAEKAA